jgi:hypothetical protein
LKKQNSLIFLCCGWLAIEIRIKDEKKNFEKIKNMPKDIFMWPGNTRGESITVPLTSWFTGLD